MKRRLFNLAAAVSLALFIATATLWAYATYTGVVSIGGFGNFPFGKGSPASQNFVLKFAGYGYVITARAGGFEFYWQELRSRERPLTVGSQYAEVRETVLGFGLNRAPDGVGPTGTSRWARQGVVRAPLAVLLLLFAALPAWWAIRFTRLRTFRSRRERGHCPACGYDLRATPGRCPECGAKAAGA